MRRCVWSRNLKNEEAMTRVGSQRHRKKKNSTTNTRKHVHKRNISWIFRRNQSGMNEFTYNAIWQSEFCIRNSAVLPYILFCSNCIWLLTLSLLTHPVCPAFPTSEIYTPFFTYSHPRTACIVKMAAENTIDCLVFANCNFSNFIGYLFIYSFTYKHNLPRIP